MTRKPLYKQLYFWVFIAMILGVLIGWLAPASDPVKFHIFGKEFAFAGTDLKPLADGFIRLIRMMIAPIIFTTVVIGIAGMGNLKRVGRIGLKAFIYFEIMTTLALVIGWTVAKLFQPGAGMHADIATLNVQDLQQTLTAAKEHHSFIEFIIPKTIVGAFAEGEILQVLFFSVLFGIAMAGVGETNRHVIDALEQISKALMRMIAMIIKLAPLAVLGAMSFSISKWGPGVLVHQGRILLCVYFTCLSFIFLCLGLLLRLNGVNVFKFINYLREELFIVFGTASSEPVLPRMMAKLENLGCSKPLVGLVLPAGYSFNLDGTSVYLTMGALFIAQATGRHLTLGQEFAVLIVSLITSKGAATVVGSAFITLAATLSSMHDPSGAQIIPVEGMVLILGVDWFMAQARSMTNLIGNGTATVVIARWENEFNAGQAKRVLNQSPGEAVPATPPTGEAKVKAAVEKVL